MKSHFQKVVGYVATVTGDVGFILLLNEIFSKQGVQFIAIVVSLSDKKILTRRTELSVVIFPPLEIV